MLDTLIARTLPILPRRLVGGVARRYIAGETSEAAIALAFDLQQRGFASTFHLLGEEDAETAEQAHATTDAYIALMDGLASAGVARNLSVKPSQLGIHLDRDRAWGELARILAAAAEQDVFIRIDMESSALTDATLDFFRRAREIWPRVGTVLQARLKRSPEDARALAGEGVNLRLCKGIYPEAASIAHRSREDIRAAYLEVLRILLEGGATVAAATHDVPLIEQVEAVIEQGAHPRERVEFQALLGVPVRTTLERLRDAGNAVRLYVPFGEDWYAYGLRRLKESPQMAGAIARSLFSRDRLDVSSAAGGAHDGPGT